MLLKFLHRSFPLYLYQQEVYPAHCLLYKLLYKTQEQAVQKLLYSSLLSLHRKCCGCQLPYEYSVSAGGFPVFRPVLRDCRALLRKARNDKLGCLSHSEGRSAELASAALPCHSEERSDVGISNRHLRIRQGPAVPALTAVYRITKPGHVLRRVPVLCAYCSAYFFV